MNKKQKTKNKKQPTPAHALADYFVARAEAAVAARGRFVVALSGGSSPRRLYELLTTADYRAQVAWERVFFFFGDERNVPADSPESNYRMAKTALLDPLAIAPAHVFAYDTRLPPAEAAAAYEAGLRQFFGATDKPENLVFDLVLLGLGDNAHTASLFPHTPVLGETTAGVRAVFVAELAAWRLTFTAPLINQARAVAFLVFGADKAAAVARVLGPVRDPAEYPAQLIAPSSGELHWFLDEAAGKSIINEQ